MAYDDITSYHAVWEERDSLVSTACACAIIGIVKINISVSSKDTASTPEDNRRVYKAKDAFLRLLTSFGKSVCYELRDAVICVLDRSKASWVQGGVATPFILYLVSIAVGVTYDCQI